MGSGFRRWLGTGACIIRGWSIYTSHGDAYTRLLGISPCGMTHTDVTHNYDIVMHNTTYIDELPPLQDARLQQFSHSAAVPAAGMGVCLLVRAGRHGCDLLL